MTRPVAIILVAGLSGVCPMWANARPHHSHHAAAREVGRQFVLRVQPITYSRPDGRTSSYLDYPPVPIGRADRIPVGAADHFGRGGVASIGYQNGVARLPVEAHELNAAFSSQPIGFGGVVGGDVSIHF